VPDENLRRPMLGAQPVGCSDEVLGVRREVGVRELTAAHSEAGEIETQHPEAHVGERIRDP
jgi:hypothetical protein